MNNSQIILLMLAGHLVADYTLQGWLANGKQKKWWSEQTSDSKYRFDYIAALICHSLYWSIFVCAPFWNNPWLMIAVVLNTAFHAIVDDMKANRFKLNLVHDQLLHLAQIAVTFVLLKLI